MVAEHDQDSEKDKRNQLGEEGQVMNECIVKNSHWHSHTDAKKAKMLNNWMVSQTKYKTKVNQNSKK